MYNTKCIIFGHMPYPVFEAPVGYGIRYDERYYCRIQQIQLDIARYARIQLDTVYSGI